MFHTRFALRRPVTTLMTFIAIVADRPDRDDDAAARAVPGHPLPRHPGHDPLRRLDARGSRAAHHAARRRGDRDPVRHQGDPLDLVRDRRPRLTVFFEWDRDPSAVGFEVRTKLESIRHEFPPSANRILTQMFAAGDDRVLADPHREPGGPDPPVRHARPLPEEADRAPRRRRAGLARGRRAARAAHPGRPGAARRPRRRHRAAARVARGRELLGQRRRGDRRRAALPGAPDRRVPEPRRRARLHRRRQRAAARHRRRQPGHARPDRRPAPERPARRRPRRLQVDRRQHRRRRRPRDGGGGRAAQAAATAGRRRHRPAEPVGEHPQLARASCAMPA